MEFDNPWWRCSACGWINGLGRKDCQNCHTKINEPPQAEPRQQEYGVLKGVAGTGPASGSPDG